MVSRNMLPIVPPTHMPTSAAVEREEASFQRWLSVVVVLGSCRGEVNVIVLAMVLLDGDKRPAIGGLVLSEKTRVIVPGVVVDTGSQETLSWGLSVALGPMCWYWGWSSSGQVGWSQAGLEQHPTNPLLQW